MANTTTTVLPTQPSANAVANAVAADSQGTRAEGEMFRQNLSEFVRVDRKVFFAAADRNKDVILDQLRPYLDNARQGKHDSQL